MYDQNATGIHHRFRTTESLKANVEGKGKRTGIPAGYLDTAAAIVAAAAARAND